VAESLLHFLHQDKESRYRIVIGTDSCGRGEVQFVTAIIIHRVGKGGRYFWKKTRKQNLYSMRHILYEETTLSLSVAQRLLSELGKGLDEAVKGGLEIHIDAGEDGESKEIVREIMGMVLGSGFTVRTKPEAFGATIVADKHV
jgi:hypothetical protein